LPPRACAQQRARLVRGEQAALRARRQRSAARLHLRFAARPAKDHQAHRRRSAAGRRLDVPDLPRHALREGQEPVQDARLGRVPRRRQDRRIAALLLRPPRRRRGVRGGGALAPRSEVAAEGARGDRRVAEGVEARDRRHRGGRRRALASAARFPPRPPVDRRHQAERLHEPSPVHREAGVLAALHGLGPGRVRGVRAARPFPVQVGRSAVLSALVAAAVVAACSDAPPRGDGLDPARADLSAGRWQSALDVCESAPAAEAADACAVRYCALLARTMLFVDELNDFLLPNFRSAEIGVPPGSLDRYVAISQLLDRTAADADAVVAGGCSFDLDRLPVRLGDAADPIVDSEVRGRFTTRSAAFVGAIVDSVRYVFASTIDAAPVPPPPPGSDVPGLPALLERIRSQISVQDELLATVPADPNVPQGGWLDRARDGRIGPGDELLLDFFEPGSDDRTFDFSRAEIATAADEPVGAIASTDALPPARCGYRAWHVDTLLQSPDVGTTDGMSFSPDGGTLALPI